ncbi:MAG: OmpA family protein [Polyangiaceae bacterium]
MNPDTGKYVNKPTKQTFASVGNLSNDCLPFAALRIGEFPFRKNRFQIGVYVRKLADEEGARRAQDVLNAAGAIAGGVPVLARTAIGGLVFDAIIGPQYSERLLFTYDLGFDPESPDALLFPSTDRIVLVGEVPDGWFGNRELFSRELKALRVDEMGRVVNDKNERIEAATLSLQMYPIRRSPALRALATHFVKRLRSAVFSVTPQKQEASTTAQEFKVFVETGRAEFFGSEYEFLLSLSECTAGWVDELEALAAGVSSADPGLSLSLRRIDAKCKRIMESDGNCANSSNDGHWNNLLLYEDERLLVCHIRRQRAFLEDQIMKEEELRRRVATAETLATTTQVDLLAAKAAVQKEKSARQAYEGLLKEEGIAPDKLAETIQRFKEQERLLAAAAAAEETLKRELRNLVANGGVTVSTRGGRLLVTLPSDVVFEFGRSTLSEQGKLTVLSVASALRQTRDGTAFQVQGHTDNVPVSAGHPAHDNLGLSLLRARSVALLLSMSLKDGGGGLDPRVVSAAGFGEHDPIVSNSDEAGRAKNRRVEIAIPLNADELLKALGQSQ